MTPAAEKPRRLLMFSTDTKLFEEGSAVRERQLAYAKSFDEVHIVVFCGRGYTAQSLNPKVYIYPTNSRCKLRRPFQAITLGHFIVEGRGITEITCQDPFLTGLAGVALKKHFGLPLELQVHTDIGSPHYATTLGRKIRKTRALTHLPQADTIRVVSARIKDYLMTTVGIPAERIRIQPIAVDTERIKTAPIMADLHQQYPQFESIVLMASRLEPEKNVSLGLRAFAEVVSTHPKAGLVIVGSGSEVTKLQRLARKMGLEHQVVFEPWADQATLFSYYKTADLFLNTSLFEGYGLTLVEAHAAGCPIISTDVGVAREVGAIVAEDEISLSDRLIDQLKSLKS